MADKKHAFSLTTSNGKTYISGIKEDSSWKNKLINAGCTVTSKGDLKIPDTAQNPLMFVESILGKDKIEKYGGIEFKSAGQLKEEVKQPENVEQSNALRVVTEQSTNNLIVSGLSKDDKEVHTYIKSFGGKFDKNTSSWIVSNEEGKLKQNEFYKSIKALLTNPNKVEKEIPKSSTGIFTSLSLEEAAKHFSQSSKALKCLTSNTINAAVGDKLLIIIPSRNSYTLSPLKEWNLDNVLNPNSDSYIKGKAFMLTTRDLTAAINQTSEIQSDFCVKQDGKDVLVSNEQLKNNRVLLDSFKSLIREELGLTMKWDKTAFRIENAHERDIINSLDKFNETNSLDSSILEILKEHKENKITDIDAASAVKALLASESQSQNLTQG